MLSFLLKIKIECNKNSFQLTITNNGLVKKDRKIVNNILVHFDRLLRWRSYVNGGLRFVKGTERKPLKKDIPYVHDFFQFS